MDTCAEARRFVVHAVRLHNDRRRQPGGPPFTGGGGVTKEMLVKTILCTALSVGTLVLLVGSGAEAACVSPDKPLGASSSRSPLIPRVLASAPSSAVADNDGGNSIVGLWATTFLLGDGPTIWDQAFEQWHSDGTELAVDNGVPPILGNVCVGVWKQVGKTIKLRHVTWNWNLDGSKAGTFVLLMTVTVGRGGDIFSGGYITDSYDLSGNIVPELHAEGVVQGVRITPEQ
jgi:hypothetical protein